VLTGQLRYAGMPRTGSTQTPERHRPQQNVGTRDFCCAEPLYPWQNFGMVKLGQQCCPSLPRDRRSGWGDQSNLRSAACVSAYDAPQRNNRPKAEDRRRADVVTTMRALAPNASPRSERRRKVREAG